MLPSKEIIVYDLPGSWSLLSRNRETEFYMKIPFLVLFFKQEEQLIIQFSISRNFPRLKNICKNNNVKNKIPKILIYTLS